MISEREPAGGPWNTLIPKLGDVTGVRVNVYFVVQISYVYVIYNQTNNLCKMFNVICKQVGAGSDAE